MVESCVHVGAGVLTKKAKLLQKKKNAPRHNENTPMRKTGNILVVKNENFH